MANSLKRKFLNGFIWNLADKIVSQFAYLGVMLYIARLIGPEAFGLVGMLTVFMLITESIVSNGFSQALVQRSNELTEDDSSTIFYVNLIFGVVIYTLLYFSSPLISSFYNEAELTNIARVLFLVVIINSLTVVVRAKLIIKVDFKSQAISSFIATIISSLLGFYLAVTGYSYWSLVYLILCKSIINNTMMWFFCNWFPKLIFNKDSLRKLFKFGSNLMLAGLIATLYKNIYIILLGRFFDSGKVGYFTQATNLTNFLSALISSTLQSVTYPLLTEVKANRIKLVNIYTQLIAVTMMASIPVLVGFSAVSETFVHIFLGDDWLPAIVVIKLLCLSRAITPISSINMNILNAIGRSDLFLKVDLLKIPIVILAIVIALPYGIVGVSVAIVITSIISFFINAYYPGKLFSFGVKEQLRISKNYIISALLMYVCVEYVVFEDLWLTLTSKLFVGAFIYVASLLLLKDKMAFKVIANLYKIINKYRN
ncbi:lipopolysaccharide biosynthesis protein [Pseudoalteromonas sp. SR44-8]|uniref:lipopolysaccharide biosynthesis protein n=1 Tax=Pseudoalteromonas sp. SR44-8 TaxID=2760933 RepID=UPI0015FECC4F|nr:lipopolysaccharide biosynthesis protein [Pseudoalteromonas sp. SR44-8]MBB1303742.1 lipopolysaccharide biosynthesis protein [Pseudoalteromonas sp. SR44-8]